jgi:AcrR family transcriptional regulator
MWDPVFVTGTRPTLRQRRRQDLTDEIKDVARRHLASEGLGALSLRAIARDVGMAVSALYRYFPSRDDLITALLEEAFTAQAEAVETAAGDGPDDPVAALRAALLAFREWSVGHPAEYGLMYGNPLPGYTAPAERLLGPGTRVATLLYGLVDRADREGRLDTDVAAARVAALPAAHLAQVDRWRARRVPDMRREAVVVTVDIWTRVQGLLGLEIFGQLRPVLPDPSAYARAAVDNALTAAGLRG